jgi:hypothetical protein
MSQQFVDLLKAQQTRLRETLQKENVRKGAMLVLATCVSLVASAVLGIRTETEQGRRNWMLVLGFYVSFSASIFLLLITFSTLRCTFFR